MKIEIVNKEGKLITDYELESNPFKVGETIHIAIANHNKTTWNVEDLNASFKIDKIEHYYRQLYSTSNNKFFVFTVVVEVSEIS